MWPHVTAPINTTAIGGGLADPRPPLFCRRFLISVRTLKPPAFFVIRLPLIRESSHNELGGYRVRPKLTSQCTTVASGVRSCTTSGVSTQAAIQSQIFRQCLILCSCKWLAANTACRSPWHQQRVRRPRRVRQKGRHQKRRRGLVPTSTVSSGVVCA